MIAGVCQAYSCNAGSLLKRRVARKSVQITTANLQTNPKTGLLHGAPPASRAAGFQDLHRAIGKSSSKKLAAVVPLSPLQRFLCSTLGCFPTTAGSAQFCLLCCQPEPVPESLPARPPSLSRRCPCSLPVWSGQPIHMVHRTYTDPRHSVSHTPTWGTERCEPLQMQHRCGVIK